MNLLIKYGIMASAIGIMLDGWTYGKQITIPANQIDADLTNFPMTVYLDNTNFDFTKAKTDGSDIRFTDENLNQLKFERKEHSNVLQKAVYNVLIPTVNNTTDTVFYVWYGNANAYNTSIEAWQDQTGKQLTYNGNVKLVTGVQTGKRVASFDGSGDYFQVGTKPDFNFLHQVGTTGKWTAEFKINPSTFTKRHTLFDNSGGGSSTHGVFFSIEPNRSIILQIVRGVDGQSVCSVIAANAFPNDIVNEHLIEIDYDQSLSSNNLKLFVDGSLVGQATKTAYTPSIITSTYDPLIGRQHNATTSDIQGFLFGTRFSNGICRGGVVVDKYEVDQYTVFCTNFDTIYDQNYAMVQHMGDTLVDATGNGNKGTATGTTVVDTEFGKARLFDGVGDYVVINSGIFTTGNNDFTALVFSKNNAPVAYAGLLSTLGSATTPLGFTIREEDTNKLQSFSGAGTSMDASILDTVAISNVEYKSYVLKRTSNLMKLIKDTATVGTATTAKSYTSAVMNIGKLYTDVANFYTKSNIAEVRYSNIARSDAWIKAESLGLKNQLLTIEEI